MTFITKEAPMTQAITTQTALAVAFMADRLNNCLLYTSDAADDA